MSCSPPGWGVIHDGAPQTPPPPERTFPVLQRNSSPERDRGAETCCAPSHPLLSAPDSSTLDIRAVSPSACTGESESGRSCCSATRCRLQCKQKIEGFLKHGNTEFSREFLVRCVRRDKDIKTRAVPTIDSDSSYLRRTPLTVQPWGCWVGCSEAKSKSS